LQPGSAIADPSKGSAFFDWADKKIIVVEDEPANLEYIRRLLAPTKVKLFLCENGNSLREYYPSLRDFDMILLDIRLPDANGLDLAREIREIPSVIPIIAQTAFAMTGDREMSLDAGCDAYISKPITRSALFSLIASFFNPEL
jgi:CheY-like chemotaxis protein